MAKISESAKMITPENIVDGNARTYLGLDHGVHLFEDKGQYIVDLYGSGIPVESQAAGEKFISALFLGRASDDMKRYAKEVLSGQYLVGAITDRIGMESAMPGEMQPNAESAVVFYEQRAKFSKAKMTITTACEYVITAPLPMDEARRWGQNRPVHDCYTIGKGKTARFVTAGDDWAFEILARIPAGEFCISAIASGEHGFPATDERLCRAAGAAAGMMPVIGVNDMKWFSDGTCYSMIPAKVLHDLHVGFVRIDTSSSEEDRQFIADHLRAAVERVNASQTEIER